MDLLLSDLHLPATPSPLREAFLRFLHGPAREARAVYLLGDVFESWVGDDLGLQDYAPEAEALKRLVEAGVAVHFMAGNRDFLVGSRFFAATGVRPLDDPSVVTLGGIPTLLAHGDRYCSEDHGYQRWRRFSRGVLAQQIFLHLPRALRRRIAGGLRAQSRSTTARKPSMITDVSAGTIGEALRATRVSRLIHGHTHRPAHHRLQIAGREAERIVLPDWRPDTMAYLVIADDGAIQRREMPPS